MKRSKIVSVALLMLTLNIFACSKESDKDDSARNDSDWQRGRAVFLANCVACHNNDPARDGPIGPAIKGSSQALIEAQVLKNVYPEGYKPKRPTKVMPQFPFLSGEVRALAAYLK